MIDKADRGWILRLRLRAANVALAFAVLLPLGVMGTPSAQGQTLTILHSFKGADGAYPAGALLDSAGTLYGTTSGGGYGAGTVFKLNHAGTEAVLLAFNGGDGAIPYAGVFRDSAGNLYGTTLQGGFAYGGLVFELDSSGTEMPLYTFTGGSDGGYPQAGLVRDAAGNFYGTTQSGGAYGSGTVYKLGLDGAEKVMHSFTGGTDGRSPVASLVLDSAGNLYSTSNGGGVYGYGTVFKLSNTGKETVLYSFTGGTDGADPLAGLIFDSAGNLYGTAQNGGDTSCNPPYGCGTVFRVDGIGKETVLYSFTGPDGANPYAGLLRDTAGDLYGTTYDGGDTSCNPPYGCGTVFKLDRTGALTTLHTFTGAPDGAQPYAGLITDLAGNLYGTTEAGGAYNLGAVFKLKP